jgi:hypothetical protein
MPKDLIAAVREYAALDQKVLDYRRDDLRPLTRRHYAEQWQSFSNFLAPKDVWKATSLDGWCQKRSAGLHRTPFCATGAASIVTSRNTARAPRMGGPIRVRKPVITTRASPHMFATSASASRATGRLSTGWGSPRIAETLLTPDILQEAGYGYLFDWCMDDPPVWLRTRAGRILSITCSQEINDSSAIIVQPFRPRQFKRALDHVQKRSAEVWITCAGTVAEENYRNPHSIVG